MEEKNFFADEACDQHEDLMTSTVKHVLKSLEGGAPSSVDDLLAEADHHISAVEGVVESGGRLAGFETAFAPPSDDDPVLLQPLFSALTEAAPTEPAFDLQEEFRGFDEEPTPVRRSGPRQDSEASGGDNLGGRPRADGPPASAAGTARSEPGEEHGGPAGRSLRRSAVRRRGLDGLPQTRRPPPTVSARRPGAFCRAASVRPRS